MLTLCLSEREANFLRDLRKKVEGHPDPGRFTGPGSFQNLQGLLSAARWLLSVVAHLQPATDNTQRTTLRYKNNGHGSI